MIPKNKKSKLTASKWLNNILLIGILLIIFIPSWRINFQAFIKTIFLTEQPIELFEDSKRIQIKNGPWKMYNQNQQSFSFNSFKGKPIILNFWASWCPSCIAELPELLALQNNLKDSIHVIALSTESDEAIASIFNYEKYKPILYYASEINNRFNFQVYPTTFIIDSEFNIVSIIEGAQKFNSSNNIELLKSL